MNIYESNPYTLTMNIRDTLKDRSQDGWFLRHIIYRSRTCIDLNYRTEERSCGVLLFPPPPHLLEQNRHIVTGASGGVIFAFRYSDSRKKNWKLLCQTFLIGKRIRIILEHIFLHFELFFHRFLCQKFEIWPSLRGEIISWNCHVGQKNLTYLCWIQKCKYPSWHIPSGNFKLKTVSRTNISLRLVLSVSN